MTKRYFLSVLISSFFSLSVVAQVITITAPTAPTTYCQGQTINLTYSLSPATFTAGNVFTPQLSDASGSFSSPTNLTTRAATSGATGSNHQIVIPIATPAGSGYRIRVLSSNPSTTSADNGANLTVNALILSTPTVPLTSYCQGEGFNVTYTQNCNFGTGNVYSVQLSDALGSFAAPTTIGTRAAVTAANIACVVPSVPAGTGYRVRIVTSNPVITSPDNGINITINASSGNPSVFGNGTWNAYCYNIFNDYTKNYQGFYTDNNLSFNSQTRWVNNTSPSTATVGVGSSGDAYTGCPFGNTNYSVAYKRNNIPCGYYQIDIPGHDDNVYVIINGVQVFLHNGCCDAHTNVWTGLLIPTDEIEIRFTNGSSGGYLAVNFNKINPLSMSAPITICASSTGSVTATNTSTISLNTFSWSPVSSISSSPTGTMVTVTPTTTTIYTVSTENPTTGCLFSNTVQVTVNPLPTTAISSISSVLNCFGVTSSTITASGANTYTWSPPDGLNIINGNVVVASPSVTTTYTVLGSNNCSVVASSRTVSVQTIPSSPNPATDFGSGTWNAYCYDGRAFTNYFGYYTENNLIFNSQTRWGTSSTPSSANASSGLTYQGCTIPVDQHSTIHKRTNFTCGYYQVDITSHDDDVTVLINGIQVLQHIGYGDVHTNIWTGFLGPTSTIEIRQQEGSGGSYIGASVISIPYPILGPPITICAGGPATITATPFISGASYSWTPNVALSTTTGSATVISPTANIVYTCTVIDPVTTCSASATLSVTVNPLPTTTVSPSTATILCAAQTVTLTTGGAFTYSWSPSAGLSATTGFSVIASPTVTTIYTVTGNNVCADVSATTTITVVPLLDPSTFGNGKWNVYAFNSTTFTNYHGYYTENGSGTSGYDFNTTTKWFANAAPSTANASNGSAYQGCTMPTTNWTMSFKRTNFACGTYTIVANRNDDGIVLLIDGVQVAARASSGSAANLWVGVLNANSEVEFRLSQGTTNADFNTTFNLAAPTASLSTWIGGTSTDWFNAANWCGSGVPTANTDVLIPNSKPQNMPVINAAGAVCRNIFITGAAAAAGATAALPAASLTINGSNSLDVYGNWTNNGVFNAGSSTVNILGVTSTSITGNATETFYNLVINKTGAVTVSVSNGIKQVANNMTFTNGRVIQNATLRFLNGATATGASDNSFVSGQVVKVGNQAFTFPVGASAFYRPISITAPAVATDNFTARYILADASPSFTHTLKDATIDHIGRCEYWILDRTGGTSNVSVSLTWNTTSCGVTNLSDLLVARWNGALWQNHGNGGTTGNTVSGSIVTSGVVSNFSPFTLASKSKDNPLPIELIEFNCSSLNTTNNQLNWATATEVNNKEFVIERSYNAIDFAYVATVKAATNSFARVDYKYVDSRFEMQSVIYYRMKQVDLDGKFKYTDICSVSNESKNVYTIYPNPSNDGEITVDNSFSNSEIKVLAITDITGKLISVPQKQQNNTYVIDLSKVENGIYFIKILNGTKEEVNKISILK